MMDRFFYWLGGGGVKNRKNKRVKKIEKRVQSVHRFPIGSSRLTNCAIFGGWNRCGCDNLF